MIVEKAVVAVKTGVNLVAMSLVVETMSRTQEETRIKWEKIEVMMS